MQNDKWITFGIGLVAGILIGFFIPKLFSGGGTAPPPPAPAPAAPPKVNYDNDIRQYQGLLAQDPNNYQAWVGLGNAYFDSKQPAKAAEAYTKALAIDGSSADVRTDLGTMYRDMGRFSEAVAEFKKAMAQAPTHFQSRMNLGIVLLYDLKDYKGAQAAWEDALRVQPSGEAAERIRSQLDGLKRMSAQVGQADQQAPAASPGTGGLPVPTGGVR